METNEIVIKKNEDVVFLGTTIERKNINYDLLVKVFMYSLKNDLAFKYEDAESPISKLFSKIEKTTKKESSFYQQYNEKKTEFKKNEDELNKIEKDINELIKNISNLASKQ